jgi:biopolymer transport protein ExbB
LLGTVIGMVSTFDAVADTFGNTSLQVSEGISQALITTQCGLVVGIPGLFGTARVRRLMDHARVRLGQCRIHLVFSLDGANRQVPQT